MDIAPTLPSVMITVQQVWMVRVADPTAIRSRPAAQPAPKPQPTGVELTPPATEPARELVPAGVLETPVPAFDAPTPLATAAKASVSNGEVPADLLPDVNRLFDEPAVSIDPAPIAGDQLFRGPALPVEAPAREGIIPGTSALLTAPVTAEAPDPDARLFGRDDEMQSIVGPDRAPGSIVLPCLLLVIIVAATMLAMRLTGLWI